MADLTVAQQDTIQWVIDYLEKGSAGKHLDAKSVDMLARVFNGSCGFTCGCPGSFVEGLRTTPFSTLLKVILCLGLAPAGPEAPEGFPEFDFMLLAGTTITNTGATTLNSELLGLSPGTSVTGFPPGDPANADPRWHITDAEAAAAQVALTAAYLDLEARPLGVTVAGNIGGQTLTPGVYKSTSSLAISSGELTLDAQGNPDAVFIFQIASTLTMTVGRQVILANGAQAKNVYWQVGSSATIGAGAVLKGNVLALTSITVVTGAVVEGRLLAQNGAVTLDTNTVVSPV